MNVISLDGVPVIETDPDEEPNLHVYLGKVGDYLDDLYPEEQNSVASVAEHRQVEFSSGRRLAHYALEQAGSEQKVVLRIDRRPIWPKLFVGSISHSDHLATCALAKDLFYRGVGVDVAKVSAVSEEVANRVFSDEERDWIQQSESHEWRTAMFSAKEAIFKSVNPITQEYLGFRDVNLVVEDDGLTFAASTVDKRISTSAVANGRGYFHRVSGHWLTTFVVPAG